jgi:hypothetical protein
MTSDADALNIVRDDVLEHHDLVDLGPGAVEGDRLEAEAIEEGVGKRERVDLVQDIAAELDDRELSGLVRWRGC